MHLLSLTALQSFIEYNKAWAWIYVCLFGIPRRLRGVLVLSTLDNQDKSSLASFSKHITVPRRRRHSAYVCI